MTELQKDKIRKKYYFYFQEFLKIYDKKHTKKYYSEKIGLKKIAFDNMLIAYDFDFIWINKYNAHKYI